MAVVLLRLQCTARRCLAALAIYARRLSYAIDWCSSLAVSTNNELFTFSDALRGSATFFALAAFSFFCCKKHGNGQAVGLP